MGRPPIGKVAMTAAEKQRRYRERKFGNKAAVVAAVTKSTARAADRAAAPLEARIRELEAELARERQSHIKFGNKGDAVTKRLAELEAEVARLTTELARGRERDEQAGAASLPKSYRERFEAMCRRQNREFEWRVEQAADTEARRLFDELFVPNLRKRLEENESLNKTLDEVLRARRPLMSKALFRKILACLHPDSRAGASEKMFNEAFAAFNEKGEDGVNKIEIALCGKEADRVQRPPPPSWAEMMAAREKVRAENSARAKRAAATRAANKERGKS
jgi:hypothetical protein